MNVYLIVLAVVSVFLVVWFMKALQANKVEESEVKRKRAINIAMANAEFNESLIRATDATDKFAVVARKRKVHSIVTYANIAKQFIIALQSPHKKKIFSKHI